MNTDKSAKQLANFLNVCTEELRYFARLTGNKDVHSLGMLDLCTTSTEISDYTEIQHVFETLEEVTQWVRLKKI